MAANFVINPSLLRLILDNKVDRPLFDDILRSHGIEDPIEIRGYLIDVFLDYVEDIVDDHEITEIEISGANKIKRLFKIEEGDLYESRKEKIEIIIRKQINHYMIDERIDSEEELQEVNLQDLFDLGYDEYFNIRK